MFGTRSRVSRALPACDYFHIRQTLHKKIEVFARRLVLKTRDINTITDLGESPASSMAPLPVIGSFRISGKQAESHGHLVLTQLLQGRSFWSLLLYTGNNEQGIFALYKDPAVHPPEFLPVDS